VTGLRRGLATAAGLTAAVIAAAGCGSAAAPRPASAATTVQAVPLGTSMTTTAGTWATVVMGGSAAQYNDFWQLFVRPASGADWKLVTPPGTADNGGLVLAGGAGEGLTTAFRPSDLLTYTPLSQTRDLGHGWSALSPLDAALASTPDSLAAQPSTGRLLALLGSGTVEQSGPGAAGWTTLVAARALAANPSGRSCRLRVLTAVDYAPAGPPMLGGTCSQPGIAGILTDADNEWRESGPALTGALAREPISVLRLTTTDDHVVALLAAGTGAHTSLLVASSADGAANWTLSAPLSTDGRVVTTSSFGPGQAIAVVMAGDQGAVLTAGRWQLLPALPAGTAALVPGTGSTDALAVHQSTLTVWQLSSQRGTWAKAQVITVPIEYGSST
jgi:hypothetical protein